MRNFPVDFPLICYALKAFADFVIQPNQNATSQMNLYSAFHSARLASTSLVFSALFCASPVLAQLPNGDLKIEDKILRVGDTDIDVIIYRNVKRPSGITFLSLHNNEQVLNPIVIANIIDSSGAFVALTPPLDKGGSLCRFVRFSLNGQSYYFDPNRIWDDNNVKIGTSADCLSNALSGSPDSPASKSKAKAAVIRFRNDLARVLEISNGNKNLYLVSVHNNRSLPFDSERLIPNDCASRYGSVSQRADDAATGDFFFVTDKQAFDYYSSKDFNVVQQLKSALTTKECKDGSMSIFAQSKGIPFTTVEVNYSDESNGDRSALKAQKIAASMVKAVYSYYNSWPGQPTQ